MEKRDGTDAFYVKFLRVIKFSDCLVLGVEKNPGFLYKITHWVFLIKRGFYRVFKEKPGFFVFFFLIYNNLKVCYADSKILFM